MLKVPQEEGALRDTIDLAERYLGGWRSNVFKMPIGEN
jgi:hypothetical protein